MGIKQYLMQFWKDANSYQSIDVTCFNVQEFTEKWIIDKIGKESLQSSTDKSKLLLADVSKQRELLIAFGFYLVQNQNTENLYVSVQNEVDAFLSNL